MRFPSIIVFLLLIPNFLLFAQKTGIVSGRVVDENNRPLANASVELLNKSHGTTTNENGEFSITIIANRPTSIVFSFSGYRKQTRLFIVKPNRNDLNALVKLKHLATRTDSVTVVSKQSRREVGRIAINPSNSLRNPSPSNSIESLIKIMVGSNNELTSQYSVRGGNYDENLVYVNDYEIFRPYLVSNGQQEGLSFINPQLTSNVKFYNGGFPAQYGDKMSSVLDITYRKPSENGGGAYFSLLEQGLNLEGTAFNKKLSWLVGARNKSNRNLLNSQPTTGNYVPSSSDIQGLVSFKASPKWQFDLLGNLSATSFLFYPVSSELTSSVYTSLYSQNIGLNIYFQGQEKDAYSTKFLGLTAINQVNNSLKLKWLVSTFHDAEQENVDITGAYIFGDRNFDKNSSSFGLITNPLGAGVYQDFKRNTLDINMVSFGHKGYFDIGSHAIQWGSKLDVQKVTNTTNQWEFNDSAGYSLPYSPTKLVLNSVDKGTADFTVTRIDGYVQDNYQLKNVSDAVIQAGVRYNYNDLNHELLLSPRLGMSFKPHNWKKDAILKFGIGFYAQPPFFRELLRPDGSVEYGLRSQKSVQASFGIDNNFTFLHRRARFTLESYFKDMWDVVPYDLNNVSISYFGGNSAKAYAVGVETRFYAELVKGAESWASFGLMQTKERINNFFYYKYLNAAGETISANTKDKTIKDSVATSPGWVRRPSDRLITFGTFFQDYLSTNKNIKVYLSLLYGSNLPFNIPGSVKYRNALFIDPYIRADIGFSALLFDREKTIVRSHSPFRGFKDIWASLEVFNLIDRENTISYTLIKDFSNNVFALPNRLTGRLLNIKLVASW